MMRSVLVASSVVGAVSVTCAPGNKPKKVLTGLTCNLDTDTAASCNTNCCEPDTQKCGGNSLTCTGGTYANANKATQAAKDAWADRATTSKTWQTDCCTAQATCGSRSYTCPAGTTFSTLPAAAATKCTTDAASCATTAGCCVADKATCGGSTFIGTLACTGGTAVPGATEKASDVWKNIKITGTGPGGAIQQTDVNSACCGVKPTCANPGYSCPAGHRKKANNGQTSCSGFPIASCASGTDCCETDPDPKTCGGLQAGAGKPVCGPNEYYDEALASKATDSTRKDTDCCSTKATCAVHTCSAGKKAKAGNDKISCGGGLSACDDTKCCDVNALTCGGQAGISCAVGFYNEKAATKAWAKYTQAEKDTWLNKATTAATVNKDCCTAQLKCDVPAGTATPPGTTIAAASTTPAAAARLFSAHKVAVERTNAKQTATNLVYLAMGAFAGMTVLSFVQRTRSRPSYSQVEEELQ